MGLMNAKRECCALTVLDNNLYVTGGRDPNKKTLSSVEVYVFFLTHSVIKIYINILHYH